MTSSDDEGVTIPQFVTNYYFVDENNEPISFSFLPIQCGEENSQITVRNQIYLYGIADSGLQKVYRQVTSWKLNLSDEQLEISVICKNNSCIKLQKPRKSYEDMIRSILITVHCLHFIKKVPDCLDEVLWDHLRKKFSYEVRPSENDLLYHLPLIKLIVSQDEALSKSKFLMALIKKPRRRKLSNEDIIRGPDSKKSKFIVENEVIEDADADEFDKEPDLFDTVCAICDNGGELLCCEGRCGRSFHATRDAGISAGSDCSSLGLSMAQVREIQIFICQNCKQMKHQCFSCGKLGSSDRSAGAQVFRCASTCGKFYHPECVAKLLHPQNDASTEECQKKIASGEAFTCPIHRCIICKKRENKYTKELQFAICRRCPKAYHRKCLPRKIAFMPSKEEDIIQRAWENLIPNRILIYCLKHTIVQHLCTPERNHIIFPGKKNIDILKTKVSKKKDAISGDFTNEKIAAKKHTKVGEKDVNVHNSKVICEKLPTTLGGLSKKTKESVILRKSLNNLDSSKACKPSTSEDNGSFIIEKKSKCELLNKIPEFVGPNSKDLQAIKKAKSLPKTRVDSCSLLHTVDVEAEMSLPLVGKLQSSLPMDDLMKSEVPSAYSCSSRHVGKMITTGKVEGYIEIVERLHWYIQNGDAVVDFCYGANDFSCFMKNKLDETGKKCSFKNYDIIPPKDDFNFEMRDWMAVCPEELPTGSKLIIGLNPPFGIKADLADKFINKALEFKPKLLIIVATKDTERLDEKKHAYVLIWEDSASLSGKPYCFPGSENLKPPMVYLWSRSDWATVHRGIAMRQGHISKKLDDSCNSKNHDQAVNDQVDDDRHTRCDIPKISNDHFIINDEAQLQGATTGVLFKEPVHIHPDSPNDWSRRDDAGREDITCDKREMKRSTSSIEKEKECTAMKMSFQNNDGSFPPQDLSLLPTYPSSPRPSVSQQLDALHDEMRNSRSNPFSPNEKMHCFATGPHRLSHNSSSGWLDD